MNGKDTSRQILKYLSSRNPLLEFDFNVEPLKDWLQSVVKKHGFNYSSTRRRKDLRQYDFGDENMFSENDLDEAIKYWSETFVPATDRFHEIVDLFNESTPYEPGQNSYPENVVDDDTTFTFPYLEETPDIDMDGEEQAHPDLKYISYRNKSNEKNSGYMSSEYVLFLSLVSFITGADIDGIQSEATFLESCFEDLNITEFSRKNLSRDVIKSTLSEEIINEAV